MIVVRLLERIPSVMELLCYFIYQLVLANLQVVRLLFVSNDKIEPAIIAVPLELETDFAIFALSSMITLTPGTLSLELTGDRKTLYVHVIHTTDPHATAEDILNGFHRRVQKVYAPLRPLRASPEGKGEK